MSGSVGFSGIAKILMISGGLIFFAGLVIFAFSKLGIVLPLGKLPGDISYSGKNFKVFAPITSMIIVSVLLTLILNVLSRLKK
jgi:cytosine/uracil/thiamine/allantoin permease